MIQKKAKPKATKKAAPKKTVKPVAAAEVKEPPEKEAPISIYDQLEPRQQRFVDEYLIDLNGTQAGIRAGYSPKTAYSIAHENLKKPEIQAAIAERKAARAKRVEISQDEVLHQLREVAYADPNELVEFRRVSCRYCWGVDFKYQRTNAEFEADREEHERLRTEAEANPKRPGKITVKVRGGKVEVTVGEFDEKGGPGYNRGRDPNLECPECGGDGVEHVHFKDSRNVSAAARALYAGAKIGKDGIEVKLHDQTRYREILAKHTGVYEDRTEVNMVFDPVAMEQRFGEKMRKSRERAAEVRKERGLNSE